MYYSSNKPEEILLHCDFTMRGGGVALRYNTTTSVTNNMVNVLILIIRIRLPSNLDIKHNFRLFMAAKQLGT